MKKYKLVTALLKIVQYLTRSVSRTILIVKCVYVKDMLMEIFLYVLGYLIVTIFELILQDIKLLHKNFRKEIFCIT